MPKSDNLFFFLQIICPFMMDQFYWAEKMTWLGVSPQPLARNQLLPEESNDDERIMEAAQVVAKAAYDALSSKARASAMAIAETLSLEVTCYNHIFHGLLQSKYHVLSPLSQLIA